MFSDSHPSHIPGTYLSCRLLFALLTACCLPLFICSAHAVDKGYTLGEKDVVKMTVYVGGEQQLETELTVDGNGQVTVPILGSVKAGGRTLAQLEELIREPLARDYFVDPQVILKVTGFHSLSFFISGAVQQPGQYDMDKEPTLMELIGKAGGLLPEGYGNVAYITHDLSEDEAGTSSRRPEKEEARVAEVDLVTLLDSGGIEGNIRLQDGDMVLISSKTEVEEAKTNIFIEGEIKNPGEYPYRPGLTALIACVMAGGFNEFSAPNRTTIIRKKGEQKEVIKINLERVKSGDISDILLQPGDFINIPETWL